MNYMKFCEEIKINIQKIMGEQYRVSLTKANKLNGVVLQSIVILKENESIAPNIYLEEFYKEYQKGRPMETIALDIIILYFRNNRHSGLSCSLTLDYCQVKDRIFYKLVNYEKNEALLRSLPHIKWMDLAIIFCILVKSSKDGIGSVTIKNDLQEKWNVSTAALLDNAKQNTPLLFGASVRSMDDIFKNMIYGQSENAEQNTVSDAAINEMFPAANNKPNNAGNMYVATNSIGINGAAWLLYNEELHNLSIKLNSSLYILPSSIHEVILVPSNDNIPKDELLHMVKEVNETQVPEQEILSDNVYYYNHEADTIYPLF